MTKIIYIFKGKFPWDVRLVKICKSLQKYSNEVLIVARWKGEKNKIEQWNGFTIWRACENLPSTFSIPIPENPFWKSDLQKAVDEYKPDLIIVRDIFLVITTKKALSGKNIPIVIDMAEHYPAAVRLWRKYQKHFWTRFLANRLEIVDKWEKKSVSLADGIITVCEEQKERLIEKYNLPSDQIEVVYNTPELEQFNTINKKTKDKPRVFLHHGYHTSEKPINRFLELFIEFAKPEDGFKFVIAGPGECIPDLQAIVNERNAPNVVFTGSYDFASLPVILQEADIGVVPYPPNDFNNFTLHNKVFDYLAVGLPILASDAKPLKRLVQETNAGISIPIERETLQSFFAEIDNYNWSEMSRNAIKISREKYNWSVDEQKLVQFVNRIING